MSYVVLFLNVAISLFFMPWLTKSLGQDNYSIYTLSASISSIFIMDLGLNATTMKYLAKYRANGDKEGEANFLGIIIKLYLIIDAVIFLVMSIMFVFLRQIYSSVPDNLFESFKIVFLVTGVYSIVALPMTTMSGILSSNEKFAFLKLSSLIHKLIQVSLLTLTVLLDFDIYIVVLANIMSNLLVSLLQLIYAKIVLKIKINFKAWDKTLLKTIFSFGLWIMIIVLVNQLEINLIPTVLSVTSTSRSIAIYGVAILVSQYTSLFSTALSGMFLPKITRFEQKSGGSDKLNKLFVLVGKIQSVVVTLIISGFILFGKEFLVVFYTSDYLDAYPCVILLMIRYFISSPKITMESHSYVKNTVKYSAIIKLCFSFLIIGLSFLLSIYFGALGASLSAGLGIAICLVLIDFFVYGAKQGINMKHFYVSVHLRIFLLTLVPFGLFYLIKLVLPITGGLNLLLFVILYSIFYVVFMVFFYFKNDERDKVVANAIPKKLRSFYNKNTNLFKTLFLYIVMAIFILGSESPTMRIRIIALVLSLVLCLPIYFLCYFPVLSLSKKSCDRIMLLRNFGLWFLFVLTISCIVTFVVNGNSSIFLYLRILGVALVGFALAQIFDIKQLLESFVNVMFIISFISIVAFIFLKIAPKQFGTITVDEAIYYNYWYIYYSLAFDSTRNCAVFWEPGIFATYLILCLTAITFIKWSRVRIFQVGIFVIALFTTNSLSGLLMLPIPVILFIYEKFVKNKKVDLSLGIIISVICAVFVLVVYFLPLLPSETVTSFIKIIQSNTTKTTSLTTRMYSMFVDFSILKKGSYFGVGPYYSSVFKETAAKVGLGGAVDASVSTFGYFLGCLGFPGMIFIILTIVSTFALDKKIGTRSLIFITLFLLLNKEPHETSFIFWLSLFALAKHGCDKEINGRQVEIENKYSLWSIVC